MIPTPIKSDAVVDMSKAERLTEPYLLVETVLWRKFFRDTLSPKNHYVWYVETAVKITFPLNSDLLLRYFRYRYKFELSQERLNTENIQKL